MIYTCIVILLQYAHRVLSPKIPAAESVSPHGMHAPRH